MTAERRQIAVRVGAWYGDLEKTLDVPRGWKVDVIAPATPAPIADAEIRSAIENPVGQAALRQAARGKVRPLIIVDDLTRPTPTDVVVPHLLRELEAAGIAPQDVRIMVASGAHGQPAKDAAAKKAGAAAASACRLLFHDARNSGVRLGATRFGTPVIVDREVAASDLVIGVGGVYPQHSVGFGGGSKLVLGILAQRSIVGLHYGHPSVAGSYDTDNDFRRDLDEMARMAGLRTVVTVHVDAARKPVRVVAGDPDVFYEEAALFSRLCYQAEPPGDRYDVVIANAYPMDVSLTFARSKGLAPLAHAGRESSRILIAACPEGLGLHRLFPYLNGPRFEAHVHRLRRWSVVRPSTIPGRASRKARAAIGKLRRGRVAAHAPEHPRQQYAGQVGNAERHPVHLWAPMAPAHSLPSSIPGMRRAADWMDIVSAIEAEHMGRDDLRVAIYACAPLQCLGTAIVPEPARSQA
jgi:nickel-dependent lactate racemase